MSNRTDDGLDVRPWEQKPLLRWAGSKRRLLPALTSFSPKDYGRYYEPFAGSACLFLALSPNTAVLGDVNLALIETYRAVQASPVEVFELLEQMPLDEPYYYYIRQVQPDQLNLLQRAARFIYLNRFCFNGVYRENRRGQFNVPRGVKTGKLPSLEEMQAFSTAIANASFRAGDFADCIEDAQANDFLYLDPPYAVEGKRNRGEYGYGGFTSKDIERLIDVVLAAHAKGTQVLLSYAEAPALKKAFPKWRIDTITVKRSVAGFSTCRGEVREVLIRNYS